MDLGITARAAEAAYVAQQVSMAVPAAVIQRVVRTVVGENVDPGGAALATIRKRFVGLLQQDIENVREGAYPVLPKMRVIDALALAGGVSAFAGKSRIKVIRQSGPAPAEFVFDYDAFVDGTNVAQNILLLPGDQIVVPEERPFWR